MLCNRGHSVTVFCSEKNQRLLDDLFPGVTNLDIKLLNKATIFKNWMMFPFIGMNQLNIRGSLMPQVYYAARAFTINKVKADIIHFEFSGIGIDFLESIGNIRAKKVVSCRGSAEKVKLLMYDERKNLFRKLLKKVDRVHCVSQDMVQTILPYSDEPGKIFVNYPSIDTGYFMRNKRKERDKHLNILSVGRVTFQKGYPNALFTMQYLKQQDLSFTWIIAGSGNAVEEFIFKIHEFGLTKHIILAGTKSREEVKELMENADVFYLPSLYEGVANVVLEAMSMELPVVVTKSGGMAEVIEHGEDGLLADVFDFRAQAGHILNIANDDDMAENLGRNARKKVMTKFNLEIQTTIFEAVYNELLQTPHAEK